MTNMRTMAPSTPPGGVNVVVVKKESRSSFSSTDSLLEGLKDQNYSKNTSQDCWDGSRSSGRTATKAESVDHNPRAHLPKRRSFTAESVARASATRRPRATSFSEGSPYKSSPYNPFSQHSYTPCRSPARISNASIWIDTPQRKRRASTEIQELNVDKGEMSSQSSDDSLDSDQQLEHAGLKIRSEIRQMEMLELAMEAEKAAENGEEFFVGIPSTFGDNASAVDLTHLLLEPPRLKMKRNRTDSALLQPSLMARTRSLRPVTKLKVLALRDVHEVIPRLGELHKHLQSHLAQRGVDQHTLLLHHRTNARTVSDAGAASPTSSMGQSITFLRKLKLWGAHRTVHNDTPTPKHRPGMNLWGSPMSPRNESSKKPNFLTPRRPIYNIDSEFSPNSLIDEGVIIDDEEDLEADMSVQRNHRDDQNSLSSFDSGGVGRVLSQQIVSGPPRPRGPIRVPSGLALPDFEAQLEKEEVEVDNPGVVHEKKQLPRPNSGSADTRTASTASSTSSSEAHAEANVEGNRTPPGSLFAEETVDVTQGDVSFIQNGTFVTPIRLRDMRDKHRRSSSEGQILAAHCGQLEADTTDGQVPNLSKSGDESIAMFRISALNEPSKDFALPMRPLRNGLEDLVEASEFGGSKEGHAEDAANLEGLNGGSSTDAMVQGAVSLDALLAETSNSTKSDSNDGTPNRNSHLNVHGSTWSHTLTEVSLEVSQEVEPSSSPQKVHALAADVPSLSNSGRGDEEEFPDDERTLTDSETLESNHFEAFADSSDQGSQRRESEVIGVAHRGQAEPQRSPSSFGDVNVTECIETPTYHPCEFLTSPALTAESSTSDLAKESDDSPTNVKKAKKESRSGLRRVMSLPSLTETHERPNKVSNTDSANMRKVWTEGKSEPGASSFASRFDVTGLKQRFASGQSEPGGSSLARRFDLAAKSMLRRLSSGSPRGNSATSQRLRELLVPVKDNDAFLNNYLYCSRSPESKPNMAGTAAPSKLCEPNFAPCSDLVGCGGFAGAFDAAMEILPNRTSEKETFSLNTGSTQTTEVKDTWLDSAVESAFEMLIGSGHEHGSRWTNTNFRAPSLMVKKNTESCKTHSRTSSRDEGTFAEEQRQSRFGRTREDFDSRPASSKANLMKSYPL